VYLKAPMILNGVCVIWRGSIDLQRLDGMGCLEYDDERAQQEDALAQAAFEEARRRTRDFEDRDRSHREDMEVRAGVGQTKVHTGGDFWMGCLVKGLGGLGWAGIDVDRSRSLSFLQYLICTSSKGLEDKDVLPVVHV
ncbi:hypothetical protein cypCar_00003516, partial [Cyprinus carpio]